MNIRQKIFIGIAAVSILQLLLTYEYYATGVIPGWHTAIESNIPLWGTFSYPVFFILVALVYGYVPRQSIREWYFWLHALLSILPILFMSVFNWLFFKEHQLISTSRWEEYSLVTSLTDWLFFLNQVVFLIAILSNQYTEKKKMQPTIE
ncbi:hypothetical protein ACFS7Z_22855 [Pontibacter toksunensis]|uniref:Uncharacterized protein n=1 Tax=Pontibacter toksunensis TaxID=1332631 RepID=A0ABW6C0L5_9BACT